MANSIAYGGRYYQKRKGYTPVAPTIASLDDTAYATGDTCIITGTGFTSTVNVTVGSTVVSLTSKSAISIVFRMPSMAPGFYDVQVTTIHGRSNTKNIQFV